MAISQAFIVTLYTDPAITTPAAISAFFAGSKYRILETQSLMIGNLTSIKLIGISAGGTVATFTSELTAFIGTQAGVLAMSTPTAQVG